MIADEPFEINLRFRRDPLKNWKTLQKLVALLAAGPDALRPTRFGGSRRSRRQIKEHAFAPETVERVVAAKDPPQSLWFSRAGAEIRLQSLAGNQDPGGTLYGNVGMAALATDRAGIVELILAICREYPPHSGFAWPEGDRPWDDPKRLQLEDPVFEQPCWLMVLGKPMVDQIGKARVAQTPAYRVELLNQGGAVIVTTEDPFDVQSEAARQAMAAVLAHLRPELDQDAIVGELHDRTAAIAKERAAEAARVAKRPARSSATEWRPVAEAPRCDVADAADAIDDYDAAAEQYVGGFHAEIEKLMQDDHESLEGIDDYFLAHDPWAKGGTAKVTELLVPTLGAYLGRVLVGELGGRWVPMADPQQAYVVIGDRAWFPFQRVARYLESRAATQQYSLAALFDEAAQHRGP